MKRIRNHNLSSPVSGRTRSSNATPGPYTPCLTSVFCRPYSMPLLGRYLDNIDLAHLWTCCQSLRRYLLSVLVPRVSWYHGSLATVSELMLHSVRILVHADFTIEGRPQLSMLSALTQLSFGRCVNQPLVAGLLPATLTQLCFGDNFNQPLMVGVLPVTLTQLKFGHDYWWDPLSRS